MCSFVPIVVNVVTLFALQTKQFADKVRPTVISEVLSVTDITVINDTAISAFTVPPISSIISKSRFNFK